MMGDEDIKQKVAGLVRRHQTRDPFKLAQALGILYQSGNSLYDGQYIYLKKHRYIFLSDRLSDAALIVVMAHELGHAVLDQKNNSYFIRSKTFLLNSRIERRANLFAAYLLITDEMLTEYAGCTISQFSACIGVPEELVKLRIG